MNLREKMLAVMGDVNSLLAEREELVELIAIALLTCKNLFILGDTGQAKSHAINLFRERITGARQFERLLSKQTDEEALFGRLDLQSLIKGEPRMVVKGKIPDSEIVFLDEIYKSNEAVLNSLLTALNERKYTNEGETVDIPTISFFSASNEVPNFGDPAERILLPLCDRFEIKVVTEYISDKNSRLRIMRGKQAAAMNNAGTEISLDELRAMQAEVKGVVVPDSINELMDEILCTMRRSGIHVSDRKYFGYFPLVQAKAWLEGRDTVMSSDLLLLRHYLWSKPEELAGIRETLERLCINPVQQQVDEFMRDAEKVFIELENSPKGISDSMKFKREIIFIYKKIMQLETPGMLDSELAAVYSAKLALDDRYKRTYEALRLTPVPLEEEAITS